jgi:hypothetical protein
MSLAVVERGGSTTLATLDIPANSVSGVSFAITSVADSVYQVGPFSGVFLSGKLKSLLISITPDSIVDSRAVPVTLTLPVSVSVDQCLSATTNMVVRELMINV